MTAPEQANVIAHQHAKSDINQLRASLHTSREFSDVFMANKPQSTLSARAVAQGAVILKLVIFLPWCLAVGGAILLAPHQLERIAFGPGYMTPPRGLRRFAHWAGCAPAHVGAFTLCVSYLLSVLVHSDFMIVAVVVGLGLSIGVLRAWGGVRVDVTKPLGEDDVQSLQLVARKIFGGEWAVAGMIVRMKGGHFAQVHVCSDASDCEDDE
jgi:hypothetical protein